MLEAVLLLLRSLEKGKKKAIGVQYGTARKVRATLTVLWEASPESLADIVLSTGSRRGRYVGTRNPAESRWYEHFNKGVRARMGDIVSQDRAYTIEVLHALIKSYEKDWERSGYDIALNTICSC
eukprot:scaffold344042_cov199-Cyclotella_meneghiniana.AAC.1